MRENFLPKTRKEILYTHYTRFLQKIQDAGGIYIVNKNFPYTTYRIGSTTYKVKVVFNDTARETMEDKILRIIRNEVLTDKGKCGILEVPQMSRQSERSA